MHELSIAINIIEIITAEAQSVNASAVSKIELEIGTWSGVEPDAIQMAMEEVIAGTTASKAAIDYRWIKARAACEECCNEFEPEDIFKICPYCNSLNTHLLTGKELNIKSIEVITK